MENGQGAGWLVLSHSRERNPSAGGWRLEVRDGNCVISWLLSSCMLAWAGAGAHVLAWTCRLEPQLAVWCPLFPFHLGNAVLPSSFSIPHTFHPCCPMGREEASEGCWRLTTALLDFLRLAGDPPGVCVGGMLDRSPLPQGSLLCGLGHVGFLHTVRSVVTPMWAFHHMTV